MTETGSTDDRRRVGDLIAQSLARGDATGWFEELYAAAANGDLDVPWDRPAPAEPLERWARERGDGTGQRAVVVGCGLGRDAELLAELGYATTAFDVAPTAVDQARQRHSGSAVTYVVADLLELPEAWRGAFDLVVEAITVQSLPLSMRASSITQVRSMVAPGGTLLVVSNVREGPADETFLADGPPWSLDRSEIESFAAPGSADAFDVVSVELVPDLADRHLMRWRAVFMRPVTPSRH